MFNWFKKKYKDRPDFWKEYEQSFSETAAQSFKETRFVVLDTETTGFNYIEDRILSIGAVSVKNHSIDVGDSFEIYLQQERFNPETVEIHGIIKNEKFITFPEEKALERFLKYIENSILVAHHASFDINMLNNALERMHLPRLKNKVLDTGKLYKKTRILSNLIDRDKKYSLDELAETFNIDTKDRHTAAGDAFITAIAFLKITGRLKKNGEIRLKDLFK